MIDAVDLEESLLMPTDQFRDDRLGTIVIGRNEGERLVRSLRSVQLQSHRVVYVDSDSADQSRAVAGGMGVDTLALYEADGLSASRARAAGIALLLKKYPSVEYVQFVDGDCVLSEHWLAIAAAYLDGNRDCAIVAGRRIETDPGASVYNRLCDIEWNTPVGETAAVGGDFMVRVDAYLESGGFNPIVIAGEEPDLCHRIRLAGWSVYRHSAPMTYHDSAMYSFGQWWKRSVRTGYAFLNGWALHRGDGSGYYRHQLLSAWLWGAIIPFSVIVTMAIIQWLGLALLVLWPIQVVRVAAGSRNRAGGWANALIYSVFVLLGKVPQVAGQMRRILDYLRRRKPTIIEHK